MSDLIWSPRLNERPPMPLPGAKDGEEVHFRA